MFQNPGVPPAPMAPNEVISAFKYLRAVQAGDTEAAAEFVAADPAMPTLLVEVAERIVVPVTALCGIDPEPCDGSFALEVVGRSSFVTTLLNWAQAGPDTAKGIAQTVIRFTREVLTQEHEDVADILRQTEACTGRCAPGALDHRVVRSGDDGGAHRAHPVRTTAGRCTAPRAPCAGPRIAVRAPSSRRTGATPQAGGLLYHTPPIRDLISDRDGG
jgi:hypothetical protein